MDLLSVLPGFSTKPYTHIIPSLERRQITTVDLITLDALEIAKRARIPPADVRRLCSNVIAVLHLDLGFDQERLGPDTTNGDDVGSSSQRQGCLVLRPSTKLDLSRWNMIGTLDSALDALLGGGIPTGYVTEVVGESGSGKTQFLLNLLLTVQLPRPRGLGKRSIYLSTETPLSTARLSQLLEHHPYLSKLPAADLPSLDNILSISTIDLETQDHILNYQLPVAVSRHNVGLVIIDSIAANYRAEYAADNMESISMRSGELTRLGELLRNLAAKEDIAIVVANQVSDRFISSLDEQPHPLTGQVHREAPAVSSLPISRAEGGTTEPIPSSPAILSSPHMEDEFSDGSYLMSHPVRNETLSLSHQQRFFTGWGDSPEHDILSPPKNPALGLVWSTQIACRIALKKEDKHVSSDIVPFPTVGNREAPQREHGKVHPTPAECGRADAPLKTDPENRPTDIAEFPTSIDLPQTRKRIMKLVFAPWAAGTAATAENLASDEVEFEIWKGGIRSLPIGEE